VAERKTSKAAAASAPKGVTESGEPTAQSDANEPDAATSDAAQKTDAAPLSAPKESPRRLGNPDSSTNFVAANAALRSVPGANHKRLHDIDGNDVDPETVFEFPPAESPSILATVRQAVYEEYLPYGATTTRTSHLLYPAGAQVPVDQAVKVREAFRVQAEEPDPVAPTSA
jgi:hypothetical protein